MNRKWNQLSPATLLAQTGVYTSFDNNWGRLNLRRLMMADNWEMIKSELYEIAK